MAYPTDAPLLSQEQSVTAIAEAEAGILQCIQEFACASLTVITPLTTDTIDVVEDKIDISKKLLCSMAAKESSIGDVLNGLANKIKADNGCCDDNDNNKFNCDC